MKTGFQRKCHRITAFVLSLMLLLSSMGNVFAEPAVLKYSYGEDAYLKNILDVKNTVEYNGKKWIFEFNSLQFEGTMSMYGGNVHTVWECTVPQNRINELLAKEAFVLGHVHIEQPKPMTVHVFSGDRTSGAYQLVDSHEGVFTYDLDICATRDEKGTLRVVDMVILYSFDGGKEEYYAAAVHIDYEGYQAAPADTAPLQAQICYDAPAAAPQEETPVNVDVATYEAMVRILTEERVSLQEQIATLEAEVEALKNSSGTGDTSALSNQILLLEAEKSLLNTQLAGRDTEITSLKGQIATLQTENAALTQQVADLNATVTTLNAQLTEAQSAAASNAEPNEQVALLQAENETLRAQETVSVPAVPSEEDMACVETVAYAYSLKDGETSPEPCRLRGTVTKVNAAWSDTYGNITVTITCAGLTEQPVMCYRLKGNGAKYLRMGDVITVEGILKNYKGTIEFDAGCQLISVEKASAATPVPAPVVTATPVPAPVVTATPVPAPVVTATPVPAPVVTATPVPAPVVTATPVPAPVVTATPVPAPVVTATPVPAPVVTATPVPAPVVTATPVPAPVVTATPVPAPVVTATPVPTPEMDAEKAAALEMLLGTWSANAKRTEGNSTKYFYRFLLFKADGTCDWFDTDAMDAQETVEWKVIGDMLIITHNGSDILFEAVHDNGEMELRYTPDGTLLKKWKTAEEKAAAEPTATPAPIEVTFKKGQEVEIFNRDGVKIKFTGEIEDKGMSIMQLNVLVENQTSEPVSISYTGVCNGWTVQNSGISGSANNVPANAKAEGFMWLNYEDLHVSKFSDLTEATLTFIVRNGDSRTEKFKVPNVHIVFGTGEPGVIEPTYFEYYPELPDPTAYGAMYQSSRSGPTLINGVPSSSVTYKFRSSRSDELAAAFDAYIAALKTMGFSVSKSGTQYTISHKGEKIALASCSDVIKIEILPTAIVLEDEMEAEDAVVATKKKVGDTLSASMMTFKTTKTGKADKIYSYESKEPSWWRYYEAQSGNTFVYLKGTFTNKTYGEVDIRNVYTNLCINGDYNYKGSVVALRKDGQTFENYLASQASATVYVYFEVPDSVASNMESAAVKLGFTQNFNTKVSSAGSGVYDFSKCSDVFEVDLIKKASTTTTSSSASSSAKLQITSQPKNASAPIGETVKTTVEATGSNLTYQWYVKNAGDSKFSKSSVKKATYSYEMTEAKSGRQVYCVVTDGKGNSVTSDTVTLTAEKEAEPITFQGIPWGSSPDKARTALVNAGYIKSKGAVASFHDVSSGMLTTGDEKNAYELPYGYEKVLYEDWIYGSDIKKKIGGYDVESISMLYTYDISGNKLNKDKKELISINIELSSAQGGINDLTEKLTALYGECTASGFAQKVWRGPQNSCLVLYSFVGPTLLYGEWDNLGKVKDMYNKLGYVVDADDLKGL